MLHRHKIRGSGKVQVDNNDKAIDLLGTLRKFSHQYYVYIFHRYKLKIHAQINNCNENLWSSDRNFQICEENG